MTQIILICVLSKLFYNETELGLEHLQKINKRRELLVFL